jgi:hypothetical protein
MTVLNVVLIVSILLTSGTVQHAEGAAFRILPSQFPSLYEFHGNSTLSYNSSTPMATVVPSAPSQSGAVWLTERVNVSLGFELKFDILFDRFPNFCKVQYLPEVSKRQQYEYCMPSAGDGAAVVIQATTNPSSFHSKLYGVSGSGLGYSNLTSVTSALVVEFDTHSNGELRDAHDNHVAVQLKPDSDHLFTGGILGLTADLKNQQMHQVSVTYVPIFHRRIVISKRYQSTTLAFESLPDNERLGRATETVGFIQVYVDQRKEPDLAVPVDLTQLLTLIEGKSAWIGFTAGTGERYHRVTLQNIDYCERDPASAAHNADWHGFYCSP